MRTFLLFLITCLFFIDVQAQVFVKHDAAGNNDGTSWEHAYADLHDALTNHPASEIWVASGTYKPTNTPNNFFEISSVVSLYGGFAGTESNLSERDAANNPTTLNGDINGDDTPGDFSTNRTDNAIHLLMISDGDAASSPVIVDGFIFTGGHTSDDEYEALEQRAGGGIFSYSTMEVSNCTFSDNFARSGAGIILSSGDGEGHGSLFDNCVFESNVTSRQSAGLLLSEVNDVTVMNSSFTDNEAVRGTLYPFYCNNLTVDNCVFQNNQGGNEDFGCALFSWQSTGIAFSNCTFDNNTMGNGAVMYHDGRETDISADNMTFTNCDFTNNTAQDWGGAAMYSWQGGLTFDNCNFTGNTGGNGGAVYINLSEKGIGADYVQILNSNFTDNTATDNGGGAIYSFRGSFTVDNCTFDSNIGLSGSQIRSSGDDKEVIVRNSTFTDGVSEFGGAQACYGDNSEFYLTNNTYTGAEAATSGGALIIGFKAKAFVDSCYFMGNVASFGGAVFLQNDSTEGYFSNNKFEANLAAFGGGAINSSSIPDITVDACVFEFNSAVTGGAIEMNDNETLHKPAELLLTNSVFRENASTDWGGALYNINADAILQSNLFALNFSVEEWGGAIINAATDSVTMTVDMVNNTFVDNSAMAGSELYQFGGIDAVLTLNAQNNIFSGAIGSNYFADGDAMPIVVSTGGNISNDASTSSDFNNMLDQNEVSDLQFLNQANGNYELFDTSPARDAGVADGAPEFDILGNERVGAPDAGAYEWQMLISTETVIEDENALNIFPNPVKDQLNYQINDAIQGELSITIYDVTGKAVMTWTTEKQEATWIDVVNVKALQRGAYNIFISNGKQAIGRSFVKM